MNVLESSKQETGRRQSPQESREMGTDFYPVAELPMNAYFTDIKEQSEEDRQREVVVAGRTMGRRVMGKVSFVELRDGKGRTQVYITRDDICPGEDKEFYNKVFKKLLDIGDFIGVKGEVLKTQMGEISVHAREVIVLSKSLKPLSVVRYKDGEAYDKFEDLEQRYRQRCVDLVVNEGVKDTFLERATVLHIMHKFLDGVGYAKVETLALQSIAGSASVHPFITHFNALNVDIYMCIAVELYLKRLIIGGFEGVHGIGRNFRNKGMDRFHNPESTCTGLYVQYKDHNWMMSFTEKLLEEICIEVSGKPKVQVGDKVISFKAPFRRLPTLDAIKEKTGLDLYGKTEEEIRNIAVSELKLEEIDESFGKDKLIDEVFGKFCEGTYVQPTFITDYPVEILPLTEIYCLKPGLMERFELMVNGEELANAYSELNDPIDQEERFIEQMCLVDKGDDEAMIIDQDFLRFLQYDMSPTSGIDIGIDRLVMLMTGKEYIQEVLLFPQMKPGPKIPQFSVKEWIELGVAEEWVYVLHKASFDLISDIREEKAQGLQQKLGKINKKHKLGYEKPPVEAIQQWIDGANEK